MKDKKREKVQLTMKERNYIVKSYYETKSYSQVRAFEEGWSGGKAEGSCLPKPLFQGQEPKYRDKFQKAMTKTLVFKCNLSH